ncbi:alpha/beta fold hydrolase [Shewanella fidelis]|uniref:Proline iminopeptidase n=1 Tax=Shewanella fidelis TaxID=173509 RepID=A0AAW8NQR3_9GAMM|nr:alpha/beta fold hydrolase [Shewanella fidelis]MDR8525518.1 alpha/beta fold hydrolase [Shewanella fidelis]MDW4813163.1 alpha/beta fold hydrolase [Shewanella fidelis]MDW4816957.1 alpha/beta fold hydrolase [Shewanella fidelis]MDW4820116.1 alpha/beta fold hydrolase [Shewanella fidelis]MDW4825628.1 alpha/beta fold hydrolase [Shewanella fidelis]
MPTSQAKLIRQNWLNVGQGHQIYVAQYGNPDGIPILYLHGGPGAGCSIADLALFDLSIYHVILLDQRGAGRSRPRGELKHNTLQHLLSDIESVRCWLNISRWMLAGGSFGATLALIYSAYYPSRVLSQVLWGLFIPSDDGIAALYGQSAVASVFKKHYQQFTGRCDADVDLAQLFAEYRAGLNHQCADIRQEFAMRWQRWEMTLAYPCHMFKSRNTAFSQSLASIELYYVANNYFGAFAKLSQQRPLIQCRTHILQGEFDWVCPMKLLKNFLQQQQTPLLTVTEIKGGYHALADAKMAKAVINAIREMAKQ